MLNIVYYFSVEEIVLRTAEATQLPPQVLAEEVICLDSTSSGSEDDTKGILHSIKDGKAHNQSITHPCISQVVPVIQSHPARSPTQLCLSSDFMYLKEFFLNKCNTDSGSSAPKLSLINLSNMRKSAPLARHWLQTVFEYSNLYLKLVLLSPLLKIDII